MAKPLSLKASAITPGSGTGPALVIRERLGLRAFLDVEKGLFRGGMGELEGAAMAGAVLIFPSSKGSTLWSLTLDEACRYGHAPAAIINSQLDSFVALACSQQDIPLVLVDDPALFSAVASGDTVTVDADKGEVRVYPKGTGQAGRAW